MNPNCVQDWFGSDFTRLHPLLQQLHLHGGVLSGTVQLAFGTGLVGMVGRRLARRLGIPTHAGPHHLQVSILHTDTVLHWRRLFDGTRQMHSAFTPVGNWPEGYWIESVGAMRMRLGVDIVDGGWHWRARDLGIGGMHVPTRLLLRSVAYKAIEDHRYRFQVSFELPIGPPLLSYSGLLDVASA